MRENTCLTNQSPMSIKRPVNKQSASDEIFFGNWSPVTAVVTVVAVIAQCKITMFWHDERPIWLRQIIATQGIAAIRWLRRHHSREAKAFCDFAVRIKKWWVDAQLISGQAGQSFDVKGRPRCGIFTNSENVIRAKNENIAAMWLNKVVAKFVDKDLIPCVYCAPGNNLTTVTSPAGQNVEIMSERFGRRVNQKILLLADQSRKGEEEEKFLLLDLKNLVILTRDDVDVIAAEYNEVRDLAQDIRWRRDTGMTNDPIKCRLH